jgi:toxin YoeB
MYELILSDKAEEDLRYFKYNNSKCYKKALSILKELMEHPHSGTGKPERLRYELSGSWSRRINSEHRIVYTIEDESIEVYVLAMRYHYKR